jgi:HD-GYP domain-containing protein (c-di-GMP phosphodiesterase class II)/ActR/RegA family two-component response regulator
MRKKRSTTMSDYKIIVVDDEVGIIDSLGVVLQRSGYQFAGETDPLKAIERIQEEHFDLLVLDYLMHPLHGDEVVEKIRQFNKELYILLLTGHRDLAPPLETIRALDIQGYCEKSDKFDQLILLVESGIKTISMLRTIKKFQEGLNKILQAVPKIYQLQPLGNILEEILSEIMPLVNSEHAFILVDDIMDLRAQSNKSIFKGIGRYKAPIDDFMEMLDPDMIESVGHARMNRTTIRSSEGLILPLNNDYLETVGVIYVESDTLGTSPLDEGLQLLEIYASQAASSLNNAFLHSLVNMKNEELNKTYDLLKTRYMDTIEALRLAVDAKDIYTRGHSDRVSYYAVKIGEAMGLPEEDLESLRISGIFHDVGKIGTADDILSKSDILDINEFEEIKKHPLKGAHILSAVSMFKGVVPIVQCHHERIDGRGYPQGLKGDQIPLLSRIISVADAFDAMTSDRQYRSRLNLEGAIRQLEMGMDTQFDGEIVSLFLEKLADFSLIAKEMQEKGIAVDSVELV